MNLGVKLKTLRESKNFTMEELANEFNKNYDINIGKSMISRWEAEKTTPLNTYLACYAKYFNVTLDYLLGLNIENPGNQIIFTSAEEAVKFLLEQNVIMALNGVDINNLSDEEQIQMANEVLDLINMVSYKYKK